MTKKAEARFYFEKSNSFLICQVARDQSKTNKRERPEKHRTEKWRLLRVWRL